MVRDFWDTMHIYYKTSRIFRGFGQLSSLIGRRVVVLKCSARKVIVHSD